VCAVLAMLPACLLALLAAVLGYAACREMAAAGGGHAWLWRVGQWLNAVGVLLGGSGVIVLVLALIHEAGREPPPDRPYRPGEGPP